MIQDSVERPRVLGPSYLKMRESRGRNRGSRPPLKNHKNVGFHSNAGPDSLKNKLAFNVEPPSARQRNAIEMAFRWRADDGPL